MKDAIALAINGDPRDIGSVMLRAGHDLKATSRWVMNQLIHRKDR